MKSVERDVVQLPDVQSRASGGATPPDAPAAARVDGPRRWSLADPLVQDALIAGLLTAASLIGLVNRLHIDIPEGGTDSGSHALDGLGLALALLQTVPLVWRRVAPIAVLTIVTTAMFLFFTLGYFPSFASFGFLLALYTVAAHRGRRISVPAALASAGVVLLILYISKEPVEIDTIFAECLVVGAVWFIGDGLRVQRSQVISLEDRATRFEREREETARRAVAEERRVIARELHDMVAHKVSVMVAQSVAAQRVIETEPEETREALHSIEDSGREALVEMRRLLGLLRTDIDGRPDAPHPQGLDALESLLTQVREAGLPVDLTIEGEPGPLPPGLDLSAFRIVQEALTNVMKHAGASRATVGVRYEPAGLELSIVDNGCGSSGADAGPPRARYGHLGMRERVALFNGRLWVGPRMAGGYEVIAFLPLDPARS
jgi:signal transduction histidine kinase